MLASQQAIISTTRARKYMTGRALWILIKVDGLWKRCCVSNIGFQRLDISATEFQQELLKWEQRIQEEE